MKTKYIIAAACALVISQASAEQAIPIKITEMARAKVIFSGTVSATLGENIPIAVNTKKNTPSLALSLETKFHVRKANLPSAF